MNRALGMGTTGTAKPEDLPAFVTCARASQTPLRLQLDADDLLVVSPTHLSEEVKQCS